MKRYSQTLGFLPREAIRSYLEKETCWGATTDNGQIVGYLLYGLIGTTSELLISACWTNTEAKVSQNY